MYRSLLSVFLLAGMTILLASPTIAQEPPTATSALQTQNVLLVTIDGLRWQEVFAGADETLMDKDAGGVKDPDALKQRFLKETAEERRETLMPFFWSSIAQQGAVFGNPDDNSKAVVTNGLNFSYPGYSEILCGFAAPEVDSNAKKNNPNVTVLEWLHRKPEFQGRVAAYCSWDVFPFIINQQRSGIPVNAGWDALAGPWLNSLSDSKQQHARRTMTELDELSVEVPRYWPDVRYDYFTFRGAEEFLKQRRPRVLYVSLGETDDWAHAGRYDLYLDAAQRSDQYIQRLWQTMQSLPEYQGTTSLILTTDHGRGDNRVDWRSHGKDIVDCHHIWIAALGPDVVARNTLQTEVTQSQVASTVAALLGYDYAADQTSAAPPLPVLPPLTVQ